MSRCGSVRIASILPTCDLPFSCCFRYLCVHLKRSPMRFLSQGNTHRLLWVYDRQLVFSPLPFQIYRIRLIILDTYIQLLLLIFVRSLSLSIFPVHSSVSLSVSAIHRAFLISPRNHPQTSSPRHRIFPHRDSLLCAASTTILSLMCTVE